MHDLIGRTLGQYRIIEQLGKGGMATVYKAFQPSLERYVAIKVLPPYFAHEEGFSERFVREAKAIARLDHPHILPIHDYGQDGEISYIAMKYVEGGTLKDRESGEVLPLERAAEILSQVAEALDYAHAQGVIHRDIKPANILMDRGDWVLLTDFGLARMVEGSLQLTASGVGVGTPAYMAPEQGQGRRVDGRADIYSLGIVLYEMLTGRVPYEAETPLAVVLKHVTEPLKMPRLINPDIPESVEIVILKALAKEPDHRYQTAGEMATALRTAIEDARFLAETATSWPPGPEPPPIPVAALASEPVERIEAPVAAAEANTPTWEAPPVAEVVDAGIATAPAALPTIDGALGTAELAAEVQQPMGRRRVPWWVYAVGGVVVLALIAVGAVWAMDRFGAGAAVGETALVSAPTVTPLPAKPTEIPLPAKTPASRPKEPPPPKEPPTGEEPFVMGVLVHPDADIEGVLPPFAEWVSARMGRPVEVIPLADDPHQWLGLLQEGVLDAGLMRTPHFVWLRDDEGIQLLPLLYSDPPVSGVLVVRADGPVKRLPDLRGRPVALISWDNWAGILVRWRTIEAGYHMDKESQVIYLAPAYDGTKAQEALELLLNGDVDAAVVSPRILEGLAETDPALAPKLVVIEESPPMSAGVLACRPDLGEEEMRALREAMVEISPEQLQALAPFPNLIGTDEPLADHFAQALMAIGIEPWRLIEGVPPEWVASPERPPGPAGLRAALVLDAGVDPERDSFAMPARRSLERSAEELGFEWMLGVTPEGGHSMETAVRLIEEGANVVVYVGVYETGKLPELAQARPEVRFVQFFGVRDGSDLPNLLTFGYRMEEAGFVAGALAGRASASKRAAVVGGMPVESVEQLVSGFERGLGHACPDCEMIVEFAGSFSDVELGQEMGHEMVRRGADVVFNAAGPLGSAALRAAAQDGAWVIGVDRDEYQTTFQDGRASGSERVLGSMVLRVEKPIRQVMADLVNGRFEPGYVVLGMTEGGIEVIPSPAVAHPDKTELKAYVEELVAAIREGRVGP